MAAFSYGNLECVNNTLNNTLKVESGQKVSFKFNFPKEFVKLCASARLKISRPQGHVGSSPTSGIPFQLIEKVAEGGACSELARGGRAGEVVA